MLTMQLTVRSTPATRVFVPCRASAPKPEAEGSSPTFRERAKRNPVALTLNKMVKPDQGYEMVLFPFIRKVKKVEVEEDLVASDLASARTEELEALAARELINIDMPERTRRKIFGGAVLCVAAALDAWLVVDKAGFWSRFAVTPLLCLGVAYFSSGQMGLCNIAQSGMMQVEGKGLVEIKDDDLAQRILNKVNRFTSTALAGAVAVSLAFSAIPLA